MFGNLQESYCKFFPFVGSVALVNAIKFLRNENSKKALGRVSFRKEFWDPHWERAGQLLANLFSLSQVTIPEVFAKFNLVHFFPFLSGKSHHKERELPRITRTTW